MNVNWFNSLNQNLFKLDSSDSDEDRDGMLVVDDASNNEEDDVEMKVSHNTH